MADLIISHHPRQIQFSNGASMKCNPEAEFRAPQADTYERLPCMGHFFDDDVLKLHRRVGQYEIHQEINRSGAMEVKIDKHVPSEGCAVPAPDFPVQRWTIPAGHDVPRSLPKELLPLDPHRFALREPGNSDMLEMVERIGPQPDLNAKVSSEVLIQEWPTDWPVYKWQAIDPNQEPDWRLDQAARYAAQKAT